MSTLTTAVVLVIFTLSGVIYEGPKWTSLTCEEVYKYAEETLDQHGGAYDGYCIELKPIHEADIAPWISSYPESFSGYSDIE